MRGRGRLLLLGEDALRRPDDGRRLALQLTELRGRAARRRVQQVDGGLGGALEGFRLEVVAPAGTEVRPVHSGCGRAHTIGGR